MTLWRKTRIINGLFGTLSEARKDPPEHGRRAGGLSLTAAKEPLAQPNPAHPCPAQLPDRGKGGLVWGKTTWETPQSVTHCLTCSQKSLDTKTGEMELQPSRCLHHPAQVQTRSPSSSTTGLHTLQARAE